MALTVIEEGPASLDTQKALFVPVGAASPLWFLFAGAASAGVAYWWMTRWGDRANLEALLAPARSAPVEIDLPAPEAQVVEPEPEPVVIEAVEAAQAVATEVVETSLEVADAVAEAVEPAPQAEPVADLAPKTRTKVRPVSEPPSEA
ncbi:hypothetical protein [Phenylobacterium sp.]|uniref:hypothetical protein n=1 Tax=Phenylobacterium sp. TaxID=1871053 RepID=UPI0028A18863|nr:hypothetical protein [Phenylobacterium sp.]